MDPVQAQLEADNARDLEGFPECYAADALIEDGNGNVLMRGRDAMRDMYGTLFAQSPELHCEVPNRICVGQYVVDEEYVTGVHLEGFPSEIHAVVIYTLAAEQINHVRVLW